MYTLESDSLFGKYETEVSIAWFNILRIGKERPAELPDVCHIPAFLYLIEQLAVRYKGQASFWQELIRIRSSDVPSRKKTGKVKVLAKDPKVDQEIAVEFLRKVPITDLLTQQQENAKLLMYYQYVLEQYKDKENITPLLDLALNEYQMIQENLECIRRIQRDQNRMLQTARDRLQRQLVRDQQQDTSELVALEWYWQITAKALQEKTLAIQADEAFRPRRT